MEKPDHLQTVQIREVEIQKNAVGVKLFQFAKAVAPGFSFGIYEGAGPVPIEILFENLTVDRLVVDNQNLESSRSITAFAFTVRDSLPEQFSSGNEPAHLWVRLCKMLILKSHDNGERSDPLTGRPAE